jgi:release factor glutamine methyltransferase
VLGWDRAQLVARHRDLPPEGFAEDFSAVIARRAVREPVAFITGSREFWGLDFIVTRDTLVPRPETEFIVEEALRLLPERPARILDVGTGTGCLAISLAVERPADMVVATDISHAALAVAAANARRHGVADRVHFVCADLTDGLNLQADLIVSNPPYVPYQTANGLPADVLRFEPAVALFGGVDGLSVIPRLFAGAAARLAPGGVLISEFGYGQEDSVRAIAEREGWQVRGILHDLQQIARTIVLGR